MQQHIGKRLGGYQIVEQIGQGGMATVYKAYQPSMDRYVAIKILPSHFTEDKSFLGRFTQEARTLARLEHPHILPVHDYGEQEGITYLVMRYVPVGTLKELIDREGPMELKEVARIVDQVGRALDCAHSQGVVHRDIKPSNVLIDQRGNTFLTDFGIAKLVAETAQFTASGAIIGTPAYMSPEQGMGKPTDYRCDIYSLGVVLYELVTGRVPFEAETPLAVLLKHVTDPLPLPRQIRPDLPEAVERVILKAMAKEPADRFQSAQEMIDALAEAVAASPTEIVPPPLPAGGGEATTLVRSPSLPPPPPADITAAPAADIMPPPAVDTARRRLEAMAQTLRQRPWPFLIGGATLLALLAIALFVVWKPSDGESTPTALSQVQATYTAESQPAAGPSAVVPEQVQSPPGWTNYSNGNFVFALARQGDILWAGGDGGLVRWNLTGSSYVTSSSAGGQASSGESSQVQLNLTEDSYVKFGIADGLASSRINDLLVDEAGVLWIATDAGINRYDGESMRAYDEADGLDSSQIQTLFLDEEGRLWAGSTGGERGLNYYDGQGWGLPPIPPLPIEYPNIQVLGGNQRTGLFVGLLDRGLAYYDGESWTLFSSEDGLAGPHVVDLLWTEDGLWVTSGGGVVRFDPQMGEPEIIPQLRELSIYAMHQSGEGELWFAGDEGAMRFDPDTSDWQHFEPAPGALPARRVTDIVEDGNGLWFGTYGGGVAFYDGSRWETWTTDDELGGNLIQAIRQDKERAIWFTHEGTGLSRYEPEGNVWQVFGEAEGALDWPCVPGVDYDGKLWIADSGELARYDGEGWQKITIPELVDVQIDEIEIGPDGVQWFVTDRGLKRYDPTTEEWTTFTSAEHPIIEEIWSILVASDGGVWVGGEEGLARYDGTTWSNPEAAGDAPRDVSDLAEAPDGSLWIAADGKLGHLADGRWSYFAWPSDDWLEWVAVGPDGSAWTGGVGLGRYDPGSGDWQLYTTADGLAHSIVTAIHVTPEGVVWIGTQGGVSRYVPTD